MSPRPLPTPCPSRQKDQQAGGLLAISALVSTFRPRRDSSGYSHCLAHARLACMKLSPEDNVFVGLLLIIFGIAILVDFSLLKAAFYIAFVYLSAFLFL